MKLLTIIAALAVATTARADLRIDVLTEVLTHADRATVKEVAQATGLCTSWYWGAADYSCEPCDRDAPKYLVPDGMDDHFFEQITTLLRCGCAFTGRYCGIRMIPPCGPFAPVCMRPLGPNPCGDTTMTPEFVIHDCGDLPPCSVPTPIIVDPTTGDGETCCTC